LKPLAWPAVALALLIPSLMLGWSGAPELSALALHPAQGWAAMPWWACWTPAWVHASAAHFLGNVLAMALIGLLGVLWRANTRDALAWLMAWPFVHLGLMLDPRLSWYVGASGVLHAGAAILILVAWHTTSRILAVVFLSALLIKLCLDVSAGFPLANREGLGVAVAPLSHVLGTFFGLFLAGFHRVRFS
jgi:membrane associated rhomboid family serine protease